MSAVQPQPAVAVLPDRRRLGLRLMSVAGVIVLAGAALTTLPGLEEVRRRFAEVAPQWLAVSLLLQLGSCLAFVVVFRGVFSRRLGWGTSYELGMAVQGTNVLLPTGGASGLALGAWALHRTGMPADRLAARTVAFFVLTSSVNFVTAVLAGTALALGLLPGDVPLAMALVPVALAIATIAAVLALPHLLPPAQGRSGRVGRTLDSALAALGNGIDEARALVRSGDVAVVAGAVGYMAFDVAALAAAFGATGTVPPLGVLLLAYVIGQLGGLVPMPGGVGGADGGLIAVLALYGTPLGEAAAAVLAYRVFQLCLPAVLGSVAVLRLPSVLARAQGAGREPGPAQRPATLLPAGGRAVVRPCR